MSFDADALRKALADHGRVARVVVAAVRGSAPREPGAAMLVWPDGQAGTIGGGTLELEAAAAARDALVRGPDSRVTHCALGPALGQCCGGAVRLVTEVFDASTLDRLIAQTAADCVLRPVGPAAIAEVPLSVRRALAGLRNGSGQPEPRLNDGWLIEPLAGPHHALWLHGAGHVGRAVVGLMAALPDWSVTWVDTAPDRFPAECPAQVTQLVAREPQRVVGHAPAQAHHLVMTYSHALDLDLCHALLEHGFASAGLIGSATKWARFRARLRQLGHVDASINRITCPIGAPSLGKHPQAIAIGTVASLLETAQAAGATAMERPA
jgi:xanthine dehydrogenase accessory factor